MVRVNDPQLLLSALTSIFRLMLLLLMESIQPLVNVILTFSSLRSAKL